MSAKIAVIENKHITDVTNIITLISEKLEPQIIKFARNKPNN